MTFPGSLGETRRCRKPVIRFRSAAGSGAQNNLGYRLLGERRYDQAIAILELNASEHPESANVYDSLGEAYHKAGRPDPAARNYRKALQLDPSNGNARSLLEQLRR